MTPFRALFLSLSLLTTSAQFAAAQVQDDFFAIGKVKIAKVNRDALNQKIPEIVMEDDLASKTRSEDGLTQGADLASPGVGEMIAQGKELIAFGEQVYELVNRGRTIQTLEYAPISVLPKENGNAVDMFDTEDWKTPYSQSYEMTYTNIYGFDVVTFNFNVIFAYGGTYKNKGAYLASIQIVPEKVMSHWGFTFSAVMKLVGLQNHGKTDAPIAGAIISMSHKVETILQTSQSSVSFHITGKGGFKQL